MQWNSFFCRVLRSLVSGLAIIFSLLTAPCFAQELTPLNFTHNLTPLDTTVYTVVEHQPEFPGSEEYMLRNVRYPAEAQKAHIKGRVFASFVVEVDGRLTNVSILKGLGYGCDEEAIRMIKAMPRWKPGRQSGKTIRVHYNLPILFTPIAPVSTPPIDSLDCSLYGEKQPEFPGGQRVLTDYLSSEVRYPLEAQKAGIKGRVFANFIIDTLGNVSNIRIIKGIGYGCDEEALRVIRSLPRWKPGCMSHKRANVLYNLPVFFGVDYPTVRKR